MSLERLRRFCEVARAGSISQAQESNRRVQSSYSRDIIALESYFGFRLFGREAGHKRSGQRLNALTPQGRALLFLANDIFHRLDDFRDFNETPKRLRLGGGESVLHWVIGTHLSAITAAMPNTTVDIISLGSQEESLALLQDGRLDFAIVEESAAAAAPFRQRAHALGTLTFSLFMHPDSIERTKRREQSRLLSKTPWIALNDFKQATAEAIDSLEKAGTTICLAATLSSFRQATTALRDTNLAALFPTVAETDMARLGFVPLDIPALRNLTVPISLLYNEEQLTMRPYLTTIAETLAHIMVPSDGTKLT